MRVFIAVCKLGVVTVVLFVAVVLVRGTSPWSSLRERWAMHQCASLVQADLDRVIPFRFPKVEACTGSPEDAVCDVQTVEAGVKKTAPVRSWDCTRRHVPDGLSDEMRKLYFNSKNVDVVAKTETLKRHFTEAIQYVAARLKLRQDQLR